MVREMLREGAPLLGTWAGSLGNCAKHSSTLYMI